MLFELRHVVLKDGRAVTLRAAVPEDADAFILYVALLRDSTPYVVTTNEEAKPASDLREEIANLPDRPGSVLVLAFPDGEPERVVGDCGLYAMRVQRMAHVANIGMGCDEHWRGIGLGTALLAAAVEHARAHSAIRRVELGVFTENSVARRLYRNLGFVEEGIRRERFAKRSGGYSDEVIMGCRVDGSDSA